MSNLILADFNPEAREYIKQVIRDFGAPRAIQLLSAAYPDRVVFIKAMVKNIVKRWKQGVQ